MPWDDNKDTVMVWWLTADLAQGSENGSVYPISCLSVIDVGNLIDF